MKYLSILLNRQVFLLIPYGPTRSQLVDIGVLVGISPHCQAKFERGIMYVHAHSGAVVGLCAQRALDIFMSQLV